jgi:hypothetical protein
VYALIHASSSESTLEQVKGDERRHLGWWSESFESRTPSWWVGTVQTGGLPTAIATLLVPAGSSAVTDVEVALSEDAINVTWREGDVRRGLMVGRDGAPVTWRSSVEGAIQELVG